MIYVLMDRNYPAHLRPMAWESLLSLNQPITIIKEHRSYMGDSPIVQKRWELKTIEDFNKLFQQIRDKRGMVFMFRHSDYGNSTMNVLEKLCTRHRIFHQTFLETHKRIVFFT